MKNKIQEVLHITSSTSHLSKLTILFVAFLLTVISPSYIKAQTLGDVWSETYSKVGQPGTVGNIYPNKNDNNYTVIAVEADEDGKFLIGKIYQIDESGTSLGEITVNVKNGAYASKVAANYSYDGVKLEAGIAFKRNDGGVLAFFNIYDKGRPLSDRQPGDWNGEQNQLKEGVWVIGYDGTGNKIVDRIDRGTAVLNGLQLQNAKLQGGDDYSGYFMVGGLDASYSSDNNANHVTLLRIYNPDGGIEKDYRGNNANLAAGAAQGTLFNLREVVSLNMAEKQNPNDPDKILIATIQYLARIDNFNNTTAPAIIYSLKSKTIPFSTYSFGDNPNVQSMTPTKDGGMFVESLLQNDWQPTVAYKNGRALIRLVPIGGPGSETFEIIYAAYTERPSNDESLSISYNAPYLLPNGDYGGVVQRKIGRTADWASYIYELKDLTPDNYNPSTQLPALPNPAVVLKPFPEEPIDSWVSLEGNVKVKRSSKVNGFFAVGSGKNMTEVPTNPTLRSKIIKLSTCANFVIDNVPSLKYKDGYYFVLPRESFKIDATLTYAGASAQSKSDITYTLSTMVYSGVVNGEGAGFVFPERTGTAEETNPTGSTGSGSFASINDSFTVSGDQPAVQYILTSSDNYEINGEPQVCQQTTIFYLIQQLYGGVTQGPAYMAVNSPLPSALYVENASGGLGTNSYQWEQFVLGNWVEIVGATSESYLPAGNVTVSSQFRRKITNVVGSAYSEPFTVTVMTLADVDVVSLPTAIIEGGNLIIKTAVKNISPIASGAAFKITVYKNNAGNATKVTFADSEGVMAGGDTRHYTITIPNYTTDLAWSNPTQIVVSFNDNGNTNADQSFANPQNLDDAILQIKN